ncbi:MAG: hypothetical protein FGF51_00670 [Candidatus Brockarchaeota archaeon]|nr:hypothetical protein [Candidatus Brockarchaeota archaeon]MBO3808129.1 hypothetical protein [Candidatus Brockarchaeota archaeon]MBO3831888.1 hypothetical protein [Candidatus Brockarchaeota archaeon]
MPGNKFEEDVETLVDAIGRNVDQDIRRRLENLKNRLIELSRKGLVKINHSVMELVCAKHLMLKGYDVDVEHDLGNGLVCDVYAVRGHGTLAVEVETGYVPPENALDPELYCRARVASKITRYSVLVDKFGLGIPPYYVLQIPSSLVKPPRFRRSDEIIEVKSLCDLYYKNPPVGLEEIKNSRLHTVYVIDVAGDLVSEVDPEFYVSAVNGLLSLTVPLRSPQRSL